MITKEQAYVSVLGTGVDIERRMVFVMGEINHDSAYRFIPALKMLDETEGEIRIVMNSEGGEETSGYAMYDAIMCTKNKVIIDGYGQVASIAAIVFQAADERRLSVGCEYMIHNGSIGMEEQVKQNEIVELAESVKRGNKRYHAILTDNSHFDLDQIQKLCKDETYFTAKETVEAKLADSIIPYIKKKRKIIKKKRKK